MNPFELKPVIYFDEDGWSADAEVETQEPEDVDTAVEDLLSEPAEESTEQSEPSEEEAQDVIDRQEYEALQERYKNSSQEGIKLSQELKSLKEELESLKSKGAAVFGKEEEPEPEIDTNTPFDKDEYDRLYIDEGPAAAYLYAQQQIQAQQQNEQITQTIQEQEAQSEQFNREIAMGRARELLLQEAQKAKDDELINKYKDDKYVVTVEELEKNKAAFEQWNKEAQYVIDYFKRAPIKINGEVKSYKGKYPADAFKQAYRALNYDNDIERTQIETAESTAELVAGSSPKVTTMTPSGPATADRKVKFTGSESEYEARLKARQVSDEDLDRELQKRGLG